MHTSPGSRHQIKIYACIFLLGQQRHAVAVEGVQARAAPQQISVNKNARHDAAAAGGGAPNPLKALAELLAAVSCSKMAMEFVCSEYSE